MKYNLNKAIDIINKFPTINQRKIHLYTTINNFNLIDKAIKNFNCMMYSIKNSIYMSNTQNYTFNITFHQFRINLTGNYHNNCFDNNNIQN